MKREVLYNSIILGDAIAKVMEREETCSILVNICDACFLDENLA
jgi:hypothetical protein